MRSPRSRIAPALVSVALLSAAAGVTLPALAAVDSAPQTIAAKPTPKPTTPKPTGTQRPTAGPATASAVALPTMQVSGVVWAQVIVGHTVFATGNFTTARPSGVAPGGPGERKVGHLVAYDLRTGAELPSFRHTLNAQGLALTASPDRKRVYVGGDFTSVDGTSRGHVAAFDAATGQLLPFDPNINGQVRTLAATADTLYAGGAFYGVQGVERRNLASFSTADAKLTSWAPKADNGYVWSLAVAPDRSKVIAAGAFTGIDGHKAPGSTALDPKTGKVLPWAANSKIIVTGGGRAGVSSVHIEDGNVYGTAFVQTFGGALEGTFSAKLSDGSLNWVAPCKGDAYDAVPLGGALYIASHQHDCSVLGGFPDHDPPLYRYLTAHSLAPTHKITTHGEMADWFGEMAPDLLTWFPELKPGNATGQYQAAWSITGDDDYVVVGGEFPSVNGQAQQGLTRFSRAKGTPNATPQFQTTPARTLRAPVAKRDGAAVSVGFQTAWDQDTATLTYDLVRDRGGNQEKVVASTQVTSSFWNLPDRTLTDPSPTPGEHTWTVRVSDGTGRVIYSGRSNRLAGGSPAAATTAPTTAAPDPTTGGPTKPSTTTPTGRPDPGR